MQPVSAAEAARQLGIHQSQITRGIASGLIINHGAPGRPLVDVDQARDARANGIDKSKQRGPDAPLFAPTPNEAIPSAGSYQEARGRRENVQAEKAEIELRRLRGETLDRAEVVDVAFRLGQMLRDAMETRRPQLAQRLAGLDTDQIIAVLTEADESALNAMADEIARSFAQEVSVAA